MELYKFLKNQGQYKKGDVIKIINPNKLLKVWIEKKIVEKTSKPKK